jgi:GTP-binding protein
VRGGRGGAGAASFGLTRDGRLGAPAGGNGGPGGSVYIQASTSLTSLHTLPRRYLADQGRNGGRDVRHGQAGNDLIITVPVGTVVTEIAREGDEEAHWARMEQLGIEMEDRKWDRWERWFQISHSNPFDENYYTAAERLLRREKKWATRTPTFEERPPIVLDLDKPTKEPILIAPGGTGGMGNPFFAGVVGYRQPRFSSRGLVPYTSTFELELKILADVGLVGFPNAGKSTILRALTGRRAEVAGYQFTTLNPQVGVVRVWDDGTWNTGSGSNVGDSGVVEESWKEKEKDTARRSEGKYAPLQRAPRVRDLRSVETRSEGDAGSGLQREKIEAYRFTISDNPGLLPQAAENVGLGHSFLRSIERSLALAYVLDISRTDPDQDLLGLRAELNAYKPGLADKAAVVVLNKGDEADEQAGKEKLAKVKAAVAEMEEAQGGRVKVVVISGKYGLGLDRLVRILGGRVEEVREQMEREKEEKAGGRAL